MVKINLDIAPMGHHDYPQCSHLDIIKDSIDAMVFEDGIGQSELPPEAISNTLTYILNLRHREVELRGIYAYQLEPVIDRISRFSAEGITAHLGQLQRPRLLQEQQVIIDELETWVTAIGVHTGPHVPCIFLLEQQQHPLQKHHQHHQPRSCIII